MDFINLNGTALYFGPGDTIACANVTIIDDRIVEENEYLMLSFNILADIVEYTFIGPSVFTFQIVDNDGKFYV